MGLTLNSNFSFSETKDIGQATNMLYPLGSDVILTEHDNSSRNAKERYLVHNYPKTWPTLRTFSIQQEFHRF